MVIVADKGFRSESNFKFLKEKSLSYIIPLRRNDLKIHYEILNILDAASYDGAIRYSGRTIFYKVVERAGIKEVEVVVKKRGRKVKGQNDKAETKIEHSKTDFLVLYYDEELAHKEKKDYQNRMHKNFEGYDLENYSEKQKRFEP